MNILDSPIPLIENQPLIPTRIHHRAPTDDAPIEYDDFTTIDWTLHSHHSSDDWNTWGIIMLIGIAIGSIVGSIEISSSWLADTRQGICKMDWYLSKDICCIGQKSDGYCSDFVSWSFYYLGFDSTILNFIIYVLFSISFSALSCHLCIELSRISCGSGLPELKTIMGGFVIKGFFGFKALLVKSISLVLAVSSGLVIGKEGPLIHISTCAAYQICKKFKKYMDDEAMKRRILSSATAAGVASAFGAPISGVLFSLEEISTFFPTETMIQSFFCALVSTFVLQIFDPYRYRGVMFAVETQRVWHFFELLNFAFLGVCGGLFGSLFIQGAKYVSQIPKVYDVRFLTILSFFASSLAFFNYYLKIDGYELLEILFAECTDQDKVGLCDQESFAYNIFILSLAFLFKLFVAIAAFGTMIPSGVFIPSMICGGIFGRIIGMLAEKFQQNHKTWSIFQECANRTDCVAPGMYALIGAMSFFGGITKMTLTLTIMMFELTGNLNYVTPCMICLAIAKLVGDLIIKGGITDQMIQQRALPHLNVQNEDILGTTVGQHMTLDLVCLRDGMYLSDLKTTCFQNDFKVFPVVEENMSLMGIIQRTDLIYALDKIADRFDPSINQKITFSKPNARRSSRIDYSDGIINIGSLMNNTPLSVDPRVSIEFVIDMFKKLGAREIIIKRDGKLLGIITKKDILQAIENKVYAVPVVGASSDEIEMLNQ